MQVFWLDPVVVFSHKTEQVKIMLFFVFLILFLLGTTVNMIYSNNLVITTFYIIRDVCHLDI